MVKQWKQFREVITTLYIKDGHTLKQVQKIMQDQHGFDASIRSYRHKFDLWNLQKYNCKKRSQRRAEEVQRQSDVPRGLHQYSVSPPTSPEGMTALPAMIPPIVGKGYGSRYYDTPWTPDGLLPQLPSAHYIQRQRYLKHGHGHSSFHDRKYEHRLVHASNDPWYSVQPAHEHYLPSFSDSSFSPEH